MELHINNLGPIKKGTIPLNKKFLFFVGYNNSGKSYTSQVIWAIYNEKFRRNFIKEIKISKITKAKKVENFALTEKIIVKLILEFGKYIKRNINTILNSNQKQFKKFNLNFELSEEELKKIVNKGSRFTITNNTDTSKKIKVTKESGKNKLILTGDLEHIDFNILKNKIIEFYFLSIFESAQSFFLPSIRGAYINLFQYINKIEKEKKDLLDEYLNSSKKNKTDIDEVIEKFYEAKSSYTQATNYLINKLVELNTDQTISKKYIDFFNNVLKIIGGEIKLEKTTEGLGISKFYLKLTDTDISLPMHISSSTTNQLAPLLLFFKYWGHKSLSDMLIMDEPEENLHPTNQIAFLKMMFEFSLVDNNKVLLTSHSSLMSKYINSVISYNSLSNENKKIISEQTGETFPTINTDDIEVCFFDGKKIYSYDSNEYGIVFNDFLQIENTIADNHSLITNRLYKQINKND